MQHEQRILDTALETLINRLKDLRQSIMDAIFKLEHHENVNWPSILDSFALQSGQLNSVLKVLKNEKTVPLRNYLALPILLSQDTDDTLNKLTDTRINTFSHDIVPDYLRTKPEPEVEQKQQQLESRICQINMESGQRLINNINKIVNHALELLCQAKEDWETEANNKSQMTTSFLPSDTQTLLAITCLGKNLKAPSRVIPSVPLMTTITQSGSTPQRKTPSTIKTTIKAASNTVRPYNK